MNPPTIFKLGDEIEIDCDGRVEEGQVVFGSKNGISLVIGYEAILQGFVGTMAIMWDEEEARWFNALTGETIGIRKK